MRIVECTWIDSNRYMLQEPRSGPFEPETIHTCGYLVDERDDCVVITQDVYGNDVRGTIVIPRAGITSLEVVKDEPAHPTS